MRTRVAWMAVLLACLGGFGCPAARVAPAAAERVGDGGSADADAGIAKPDPFDASVPLRLDDVWSDSPAPEAMRVIRRTAGRITGVLLRPEAVFWTETGPQRRRPTGPDPSSLLVRFDRRTFVTTVLARAEIFSGLAMDGDWLYSMGKHCQILKVNALDGEMERIGEPLGRPCGCPVIAGDSLFFCLGLPQIPPFLVGRISLSFRDIPLEVPTRRPLGGLPEPILADSEGVYLGSTNHVFAWRPSERWARSIHEAPEADAYLWHGTIRMAQGPDYLVLGDPIAQTLRGIDKRSGAVRWRVEPVSPTSVAVDNGMVFWSESELHRIDWRSVRTGATGTLVTGEEVVRHLEADANWLVWARVVRGAPRGYADELVAFQRAPRP